ncbi:helix-turn-helix domain-containing protein [Listeria sp. ILCC797]|uniref:helix-turn-helix domain-containing protein n=1 Tax=Listeria sp. ILCC797 TaxID=1918333 RepID=UPI000B598383|nr:helix-turn-helix transcriptional regulator [Listeria sp. ILCC797]
MTENKNKLAVGKTLKSIRTSIGLKQVDVYTDIMSRTHLQRLENCTQTPSYPLLLDILERFSMDLSEFEYIRNGYAHSHIQEIFNEFRRLGSTLNKSGFQNLISKIEALQHNGNSDTFLNHLKSILFGYMELQESQNINTARHHFDAVWQDLKNRETWYYNDIVLMSNIFYIFAEEPMSLILQRLNKFYDKYAGYRDIDKLSRTTKFNYCTLLRVNDRILETKPIIEEVLEDAKEAHDCVLILSCKFILNQIYFLGGEHQSTFDEVKKIIQSMRVLGEDLIADDMLKDWEKLIKNSKIPL